MDAEAMALTADEFISQGIDNALFAESPEVGLHQAITPGSCNILI